MMIREQTVAELMTRAVVTVLEEDNLQRVSEKLAAHPFHHLPVLDGPKLVGMLSQRDMLRATVAGIDRSAVARAREARFLEQTFVRDVMQTELQCARPSDSLQSAARRMVEARIGALPVTDDEQNLLGIVTENDLARALASAT